MNITDLLLVESGSASADLPVSTVDNGDTTFTHTYGFQYRGGKATIALYSADWTGTTVTLQAAFDGGTTTDNNSTAPVIYDGEFINLTDSSGQAVTIGGATGSEVVTVDIGKCMLRFKVTTAGTTPADIKISVS